MKFSIFGLLFFWLLFCFVFNIIFYVQFHIFLVESISKICRSEAASGWIKSTLTQIPNTRLIYIYIYELNLVLFSQSMWRCVQSLCLFSQFCESFIILLHFFILFIWKTSFLNYYYYYYYIHININTLGTKVDWKDGCLDWKHLLFIYQSLFYFF